MHKSVPVRAVCLVERLDLERAGQSCPVIKSTGRVPRGAKRWIYLSEPHLPWIQVQHPGERRQRTSWEGRDRESRPQASAPRLDAVGPQTQKGWRLRMVTWQEGRSVVLDKMELPKLVKYMWRQARTMVKLDAVARGLHASLPRTSRLCPLAKPFIVSPSFTLEECQTFHNYCSRLCSPQHERRPKTICSSSAYSRAS